MRNLLQIVQAACDEMSLPRPSVVAGATDDQARQLFALANRAGQELADREGPVGCWPELRKEWTQTIGSSVDNYAAPDDLRYFLNTTAWDRTNDWPLMGPINPQVWQVLKSGTIGSTGPRTRFRRMAGRIYFDPVPATDQAIVIEYCTSKWCTDSTGATARERLSSDSDVPLIPDDAFVLELKWRFRRAKGLDYQEEFNEAEDFINQAMARAAMGRVLSLTGEGFVQNRLLDESNVPDSGFG
jgi:hypothetical protein